MLDMWGYERNLTMEVRKMTITRNVDQALYVIPEGSGFSFDRLDRLAVEMGKPTIDRALRGTLSGYYAYAALLNEAKATGQRFSCDLTPQLIGLEGHRVSVETVYDGYRRFIVGKSTGWMPIHLEIARRNSSGGRSADRRYTRVTDLGRVR